LPWRQAAARGRRARPRMQRGSRSGAERAESSGFWGRRSPPREGDGPDEDGGGQRDRRAHHCSTTTSPFIPIAQCGSQWYGKVPAFSNFLSKVPPPCGAPLLKLPSSLLQSGPDTTLWVPPAHVHRTVWPTLTFTEAGVN